MKCFNCNKEISKETKQVQVITKDNEEIIGDNNFHWQCWIDYFNDCVKKKVEVIKSNVVKLAGKTMGQLGGFLKT